MTHTIVQLTVCRCSISAFLRTFKAYTLLVDFNLTTYTKCINTICLLCTKRNVQIHVHTIKFYVHLN